MIIQIHKIIYKIQQLNNIKNIKYYKNILTIRFL